MSELSDLVAADHAEISGDVPCTVTWNGTDYAATRGMIRRNNTEKDFGFVVNRVGTVYILASLFSGTLPALGNKFTIDSCDYRVVDIGPDSTGSFIKYEIQDPTA